MSLGNPLGLVPAMFGGATGSWTRVIRLKAEYPIPLDDSTVFGGLAGIRTQVF